VLKLAVKHYVDEIPPSTGRAYQIETSGNTSTITDVTKYQQVGTGFGASDVNASCVLECNYSKSGTVHRLTTENTTSENIKFYATSAFNRGDTFTFNGTAVTAQTTDGMALGTNFFKANSIVECNRRGNVLYFGSCNRSIVDDTTGTAYRVGIENGIMYIEED
jgi:hypothetical protein